MHNSYNNLVRDSQHMGHDPHFGHWVFYFGHEPIYKNIYNNIYILKLKIKII